MSSGPVPLGDRLDGQDQFRAGDRELLLQAAIEDVAAHQRRQDDVVRAAPPVQVPRVLADALVEIGRASCRERVENVEVDQALAYKSQYHLVSERVHDWED